MVKVPTHRGKSLGCAARIIKLPGFVSLGLLELAFLAYKRACFLHFISKGLCSGNLSPLLYAKRCRKENENYAGSKTLPASIKEKEAHWPEVP